MLHHASRLANIPTPTLYSLLHAAASRAWTRTRPTPRFYHSKGAPGLVMHGAGAAQNAGESSSSRSVSGIVSDTHSEALSSLPRVASMTHSCEQEAPDCSVRPTSRAHTHPFVAVTPPDKPWCGDDYSLVSEKTLGCAGRSHSLSYEDDPPWAEIVSSMTAAGDSLPLVHYGPFNTVPNSIGWPPRSSAALYHKLIGSLRTTPPPSLQDLMSYHDVFPMLQSAKSYNVLIALSIKHASFGTTRQLLRDMRLAEISGNFETLKLQVRLMVRTGRWTEAWQRVRAQLEEDGAGMPLAIWLEFFGTSKERAFRQQREICLQPVQDAINGHINSGRYRTLMRNRPNLTVRELARVPPRAIRLFVGILLRENLHQFAMDLTKAYFAVLARRPDRRDRQECLNIIHLHIIACPKRKISGCFLSRQVVYDLLALYPMLEPDSTTLFLLLSFLRTTTKCGTIALSIIKTFVVRWGPAIVDERVRRRLGSMALKEGRLDIVKKTLDEQRFADYAKKLWSAERKVQGGLSIVVHKRLLPLPQKKIFPGRNKEGWNWRLLRRRLGRVMARKPNV